MTPADFTTWRRLHSMTQAIAADYIGKTLRTVQRYESGAVKIPSSVETICRLIVFERAAEEAEARRERDAASVREIMDL